MLARLQLAILGYFQSNNHGTLECLKFPFMLTLYLLIIMKSFFPALRGEGALKARLPKETRKNASISPFGKGMAETKPAASFGGQKEDPGSQLAGDLLQLTRKGNLPYEVQDHIHGY